MSGAQALGLVVALWALAVAVSFAVDEVRERRHRRRLVAEFDAFLRAQGIDPATGRRLEGE